MKRKCVASLAAMVLAIAALAAQSEYPSYLIMDGTMVTGYTGKVPDHCQRRLLAWAAFFSPLTRFPFFDILQKITEE